MSHGFAYDWRMRIGYARVSTNDQDPALQRDALEKAGCERIYEEHASGATANRPQLERMIDQLRPGDEIVVWKLDRLGRSVKDLVDLVNRLHELKVEFTSLTEGIDTSTPGGQLVFHIFAAIAEFERDLIRERTQAGLQAARARGRNGGRPPKLDAKAIRDVQAMYRERGLSADEIARIKGVSRTTIYKALRQAKEAGNKTIEKLNVAFVPSKDPDEIITATEPLKDMLKTELGKEGYDVGEVDITVGTSYEAVGEALSAGTADVGLIPGGTYVLYDDGCDVLLTATRDGLNKDSDNAKDWNDGKPTEKTADQVVSYRALIIAGPSEKGQELAEKVNNGEELTWDDLNSANWSVMNSTSPAGYIYPALWLQDNYGKGITDLEHTVQSDSYGSAMARLASGQVDIVLAYADVRNDYVDQWNSEYGRTGSIWDTTETDVIGVTPAIYNDTVSVSKNSPIMTDDFKEALSNAFINIGNTDEGKEVIAIYSHTGYKPAKSSDYDNERKAQELIQELNAQ